MRFPITVNKIIGNKEPEPHFCLSSHALGNLVSIRPCAKECENKTYLGLYIGDLPLSFSAKHDKETGELEISHSFFNPAIYVFDLKKIVYGAESWWGVISNEDQLKQITDADINDVWYVKALKQISETEKK